MRCGPSVWTKAKVGFHSLFYNHHLSLDYASDTVLAPMFWVADATAGKLGAIFLTIVVILNVGVIGLTYWLGLPYWWSRNKVACCLLVILGHWILAHVAFNLYKAATTPPGFPPSDKDIVECVSICKKCVGPKPPRAHHCSVCKRCVLKMDHHCPWLNNCIGHANRRYFFSYMVSVCIGLTFILVFGWNIIFAVLQMPLDGEEAPWKERPNEAQGSEDRAAEFAHLSHIPTSVKLRSIIVFYGFCCGGGMLMLSCLAFWHAKLISRGETSIEAHINKAETKRLAAIGKTFCNPYDFGWRENWKEFLGFRDLRTFCTRVLLPSSHLPAGDGLSWPTIYSSKTAGVSGYRPSATDDGAPSPRLNGFRSDVTRRRNFQDCVVGNSSDAKRHEELASFHKEFVLVKKTGL